MEEREKESLLLLAVRAIGFANNHPYAATGIFGAIVGSAVTYKVIEFQTQRQTVSDIFTPKVYKLSLPPADLHMLLEDPSTELRWETPTMVVVVTAEEPEPLKQLPVIDGDAYGHS